MSGWKMVPVEPTPEMLAALYLDPDENGFARSDYALMLAAAPEWEPSESDVERALETFCCVGPTDKHAMRAALKAAFEGAE